MSSVAGMHTNVTKATFSTVIRGKHRSLISYFSIYLIMSEEMKRMKANTTSNHAKAYKGIIQNFAPSNSTAGFH